MFLIKLLATYPRGHIYLGIGHKIFQSTKVEERSKHSFLIYTDEISSVCGMEILSHTYRKKLKLSSFPAIDTKDERVL